MLVMGLCGLGSRRINQTLHVAVCLCVVYDITTYNIIIIENY